MSKQINRKRETNNTNIVLYIITQTLFLKHASMKTNSKNVNFSKRINFKKEGEHRNISFEEVTNLGTKISQEGDFCSMENHFSTKESNISRI